MRLVPLLGDPRHQFRHQARRVKRAGGFEHDADLRATLVSVFGRMGDPGVVAEAHRRFAALDHDPHALDGPLKQNWLDIVAHNATAADWEKLEKLAVASTSTVDRSNLFALLGAVGDAKLAQRTLDLALTDVPGKTTAAAMIGAVSGDHSEMAVDFFLAHRDAVLGLLDASARTTYIERLASRGDTDSLVAKLKAYAATLPDDAKKPVERVLARITNRMANKARIAGEINAWLKGA